MCAIASHSEYNVYIMYMCIACVVRVVIHDAGSKHWIRCEDLNVKELQFFIVIHRSVRREYILTLFS